MSYRPNSARPQSRINPITGEDMALTSRYESNSGKTQTNASGARSDYGMVTPRQQQQQQYTDQPRHTEPRPSGVPPLNLSRVIGRDDEVKDFTWAMDSPLVKAAAGYGLNVGGSSHKEKVPLAMKPAVIQQPAPQSNFNAKQQFAPASSRQQKQPTAWDRPPVPDNVCPPSQRHLQQYDQVKRETAAAYQRKTAGVSQADVDREVDQLRLNIGSSRDSHRDDDDYDAEDYPPPPDDARSDLLPAGWAQKPYNKDKLKDKETMEEEKRKSKMLETVLIDQLCRPVMSDPGQVSTSHVGQTYRPGMKRGTVRTLHDSKVRTDGSSTENLLSRRVRFEARLLTAVGRDALRELTGFFFAADNTLTVYEFRQFGKTSKAMPFVKRGCYRRLRGSGEQTPAFYNLTDIIQGCELYFETSDQPVPDGIKLKPTMTLRICDVDNEAKKDILLSGGVSVGEADELWKRLHLPVSPDELKRKLLKRDVHEIVRRQISKRGIRVYTGVGRQLRKGDVSEDGLLNKFELEKALIDARINISNDKFDDLWEVLDIDGTSFLEYSEFMRGFLGEMSEYRKFFVVKAFCKMDASKHGVITFGDVRKFYNAHKHPKVRSGECTEEEIVNKFLDSFDETTVKNELTFREFEEYYEGLSVDVDSDEEFCNMLRNAWNI